MEIDYTKDVTIGEIIQTMDCMDEYLRQYRDKLDTLILRINAHQGVKHRSMSSINVRHQIVDSICQQAIADLENTKSRIIQNPVRMI